MQRYWTTIYWTFGLHFVCHCHFVAYLSRGFPISILSCSSSFFFFNYSPSYKVLGADCGLNVWGVLAELLGVSWTVVMLGGTAWQPSGKALLKIHCWESNWASAWSKTWTHTHQHTLRRLVRKMNACGRGASKPGIMTFLPSFIISDTTSLSFRLLTSASFHKDQTHG